MPTAFAMGSRTDVLSPVFALFFHSTPSDPRYNSDLHNGGFELRACVSGLSQCRDLNVERKERAYGIR